MSNRRKKKERVSNSNPDRKFAQVLYNVHRNEDLWARFVFRNSKHEECGRTRPFVLHRGFHYPDFKQGVHGTLWTRIHRALNLIDEYRIKREDVHQIAVSRGSSLGSIRNVRRAHGRGMFSVVSFDDAEVKNVIVDHELYFEKTVLLVGIYTRTVFEQLPKTGHAKIPLRDDDLHEVRDQYIALHTVSNILAHHRSLFFDGEVLRDLFSADETLWSSDSDNETSIGVLMHDYLDSVSDVLRSIRVRDLTGLIGARMSRLPTLKDHELINLLQELHCLGKLLSDYCTQINDTTLVERWFKNDMNSLFNELRRAAAVRRPSLQEALQAGIVFGFPRFHFEPELAKSQIRIDGKLYLRTFDSSLTTNSRPSRAVRTSIDFAPFLRSVAKFCGDVRLCDLKT